MTSGDGFYDDPPEYDWAAIDKGIAAGAERLRQHKEYVAGLETEVERLRAALVKYCVWGIESKGIAYGARAQAMAREELQRAGLLPPE